MSTHVYGIAARAAVERARAQVAALLGAQAPEIIFTGCATEANNLVIRGAAHALRQRGRHVITSAIEHPSVMQPIRLLQAAGWEVTVLPVDAEGRVRVEDLERTLRDDTVLVSIMHANNEVGTVQPIQDIAALTRKRGIVLHCDAAQSLGKFRCPSTRWVWTCSRWQGPHAGYHRQRTGTQSALSPAGARSARNGQAGD